METMEGKSLDITEEKRNRLKEIIPEAFTEDKIDWEKLKATLGDDIEFKNERYVLNWAGKSEAFRVLQSPTTATLVPCEEESVGFDDTENIFIEGENLEVLKVLQKAYFGKIKMIYIDPPYNTGNDKFIYPDKFSETKEEYLSRVGDKDESGYFLARNLLREDGVIFVSIDDNEIYNLKMIMNELFGEENWLGTFVWVNEGNIDNQSRIKCNHEYILAYARNEELFLPPPIIDPNIPKTSKLFKEYIENTIVKNGPANPVTDVTLPIGFPANFERGIIEQKENFWPKSNKTVIINDYKVQNEVTVSSGWSSLNIFKEFLSTGFQTVKDTKGQETTFYISDTGAICNKKKRLENQSHVLTILQKMGSVQDAHNKLAEIGIEFDYPKPVELIKYLVEIGSNDDSIILDFFAGACPHAEAILEFNSVKKGNRKFICVQIAEICDEKSASFNAGFKTISEIGKERIRRVIKKIKADKQSKLDVDGATGKQDLGFKVFKLQKSNFKIWRSDVKTEEELVTQLTLHTDPVDENVKIENILYELLLKSGVPLTARIEERGGYYLVNDGEIALMLEKVNESIIKKVIAENPNKVITLDRLFNKNDQLKTNTALQMKDAGIEFKAV
jgi:adenine-specific DNA-methyltransferase